MQELFIFQQHILFDIAATMARVQNLEGLLPMQEGSLLAHDTLVGEADWQSMVLNIIILAGGNVLPLVRPPRTHCHLTHVTRRTKTHTVQRFTVKSHGQLIYDRIHVVRHKFRPVGHAPGVLCHCGQRDLVLVELLVASLGPEHSHVGLAVGRLVARLLVWMGHREDLSIAAHDLRA